jgi:hemin uptake protein HemP
MRQTSHSGLDRSDNEHRSAPIAAPPRIASSELLRGQRKLIIDHGDATYVLLPTRNGKLILNKQPGATKQGCMGRP